LQLMRTGRHGLLADKGLALGRSQSLHDAIGDLERRHGTVKCEDPASPRGFLSGVRGPAGSAYQRLMRKGTKSLQIDSHRFARHGQIVEERFKAIQEQCRNGTYKAGTQLNQNARAEFGLAKRSTVVLHEGMPSHTLTTLPDDLIHYREPRILSVREYARLQSFPDWFEFKGPYTTGGPRRRHQCPRYTQVGNAVPPLLAEALGQALLSFASNLDSRQENPDFESSRDRAAS
jgi:DNA (cytosine-5)-methyltransferase 1